MVLAHRQIAALNKWILQVLRSIIIIMHVHLCGEIRHDLRRSCKLGDALSLLLWLMFHKLDHRLLFCMVILRYETALLLAKSGRFAFRRIVCHSAISLR